MLIKIFTFQIGWILETSLSESDSIGSADFGLISEEVFKLKVGLGTGVILTGEFDTLASFVAHSIRLNRSISVTLAW